MTMGKAPEGRFTGMTTNERLGTAGLFDEWDRAAFARDRDGMIEVLQKVELTETEAASVADSVLQNPAKYGF